jgi:hypothetical protein
VDILANVFSGERLSSLSNLNMGKTPYPFPADADLLPAKVLDRELLLSVIESFLFLAD